MHISGVENCHGEIWEYAARRARGVVFEAVLGGELMCFIVPLGFGSDSLILK
jgi:hypothetical protein